MKFLLSIFVFLFGFLALAQDQNSNYRSKKVVVKDTILIDSVSINPDRFVLKLKNNTIVDSSMVLKSLDLTLVISLNYKLLLAIVFWNIGIIGNIFLSIDSVFFRSINIGQIEVPFIF